MQYFLRADLAQLVLSHLQMLRLQGFDSCPALHKISRDWWWDQWLWIEAWGISGIGSAQERQMPRPRSCGIHCTKLFAQMPSKDKMVASQDVSWTPDCHTGDTQAESLQMSIEIYHTSSGLKNYEKGWITSLLIKQLFIYFWLPKLYKDKNFFNFLISF